MHMADFEPVQSNVYVYIGMYRHKICYKKCVWQISSILGLREKF